MLMNSDRIVNAWEELGQRVIDAAVWQWCAHLRACVSAWGGHFEHTVTEINLMIYFEWLVPCLLLNCKHRSFFCKSYIEQQLFCCSFQSPAFYKVWDNNIKVRWSVLHCLVYKVFLHICWKFDENTYTITQIMTNNVRFLFFRSQCSFSFIHHFSFRHHFSISFSFQIISVLVLLKLNVLVLVTKISLLINNMIFLFSTSQDLQKAWIWNFVCCESVVWGWCPSVLYLQNLKWIKSTLKMGLT